MSDHLQSTMEAIRTFALGLPEAHEDFPWGERVVKVRRKIFVFMGIPDIYDDGIMLTMKLPITGMDALDLPFTEIPGYGLGKSGWVKVRFYPDEIPPTDLLLAWVKESYRAVAPKRLAAQIDSDPLGEASGS